MNLVTKLWLKYVLIGLILSLTTHFIVKSSPALSFLDTDTVIFSVMSGVLALAIRSALAKSSTPNDAT